MHGQRSVVNTLLIHTNTVLECLQHIPSLVVMSINCKGLSPDVIPLDNIF